MFGTLNQIMNLRPKLAFWIVILTAFSIPTFAQTVRLEPFQGKDATAGEIIVKFRNATAPQSLALAAQDSDIQSFEPLGQTGAMLLRSRARSVAALVQAYAQRADVEYAEPNYILHTADVPNDVYFGLQYGLKNTGQSELLPKIRTDL